MAENSNIGWTHHSWNPVTGCTQVSPGCDNCYALELAERYRGQPAFPNGFDVTLRPKKLNQPAKWKQPSLIFVNSMSDLFHREIPMDFLEKVWFTMVENPQHIYQVLTKRTHRMAQLLERTGWPIPEHIWLGTSVENQQFAENRIPALDSIDAPVKWLSCEPLLGPLDLRLYSVSRDMQWVVTGGESGSGRRPANPDWFRGIRDQCKQAGVRFYHKQGSHRFPGRDRELDGRTWDEYPDINHPALQGRNGEGIR